MSYARWGLNSSVYVIGTDRGIECICCGLSDSFVAQSYSEMIEHLKAHRMAGDAVPFSAEKSLKLDMDTHGDVYRKTEVG